MAPRFLRDRHRLVWPLALVLCSLLTASATLPTPAMARVLALAGDGSLGGESRAILLRPQPSFPTPPPSAPALPIHWAYMVGNRIPDSLRDHPDQITYLSPAWFHLDVNGNIYGQDSPAVTSFARAHGIKMVPIVANGEFDGSVAHTLVTDGARQTQALSSLEWLVNNFGYDGVNLDFENVASSDRAGLNALVYNSSLRLHSIGKLLTIALPSKTSETFGGFSGAFDYAALAPNVDYAVLMAYDQHYSGGSAGPVADIAWVSDVINYAKAAFPANKLLLGMPLYGYNWNVSAGWGRAVRYADIISTVFAHGAQIRMVSAAQSPMFQYDAGDGIHQVWFENSTSLQAKLDLAQNKGLAGWAVWRLGQEDANFWTLKLTLPPPNPPQETPVNPDQGAPGNNLMKTEGH